MTATNRCNAVDAEHQILAPKAHGNVTKISSSGTTARNGAALASGLYLLCASAACHYRQGSSAVEAAATDYYLPAGADRLLSVDDASDSYVAVIGTVDLYVMPT